MTNKTCPSLWRCSIWSGAGDDSIAALIWEFPALGLARCSFSVQLDIQSTAANAIVAARHFLFST